MVYEICTYGNPILREKSVPVGTVTPELREMAHNMVETMHAQEGIGLAAQQIGRTEAMCVVDVPPDCDKDEGGNRLNPDVAMPMIIFNPVLKETSDDICSREEGCLSFPEIFGSVPRPCEIVLEHLNEKGAKRKVRLRGLVARAVLHEMDHLDGVVFIDRISHIKRLAISGKLKRLVRSTREAMADRE